MLYLDGFAEVFAASPPTQQDGVGDGDEDERNALPELQLAIKAEQVHQGGRDGHAGQVEHQGATFEVDRAHRGAEAQDQQQVDDVGAGDVADGQRTGVHLHGVDADRELGRTGADRHDRQPDDHRRNTKPAGQQRAVAHDQFRAGDQGQQATDDQQCEHVSPYRDGCERQGWFWTVGRGKKVEAGPPGAETANCR